MEPLLQQAVAAAACSVLILIDGVASKEVIDDGETRNPGTSDRPPTSWSLAGTATLSVLASCCCGGLLSWPDAVGCVLSMVSPTPPVFPSSPSRSPLLELCRRCLLGPLLLRDGAKPALLDPGESGTLKLMQAALPAEMAFSHALPALLSASTSSAVTTLAGERMQDLDLDLDLDLIRHSPLRLCLLANPAALYARLSARDVIDSACACLDQRVAFHARRRSPTLTADEVVFNSRSHLPALTMVELLLIDSGGSAPVKTLRERVELLAGCMSPPRNEVIWMLLRLSLDQMAFQAVLKVGSLWH